MFNDRQIFSCDLDSMPISTAIHKAVYTTALNTVYVICFALFECFIIIIIIIFAELPSDWIKSIFCCFGGNSCFVWTLPALLGCSEGSPGREQLCHSIKQKLHFHAFAVFAPLDSNVPLCKLCFCFAWKKRGGKVSTLPGFLFFSPQNQWAKLLYCSSGKHSHCDFFLLTFFFFVVGVFNQWRTGPLKHK